MSIICFGDSNTYGYNPDDEFNMRYPQKDIWSQILSEMLRIDFVNAGQNGRCVPESDYEINVLNELLKNSIDSTLLIMLGTNDLLKGTSPEDICSNMLNFIKRLHIENDKIIIVSPPIMKKGT